MADKIAFAVVIPVAVVGISYAAYLYSLLPPLFPRRDCPPEQRIETKEDLVRVVSQAWRLRVASDPYFEIYTPVVNSIDFSDANSPHYSIQYDNYKRIWAYTYHVRVDNKYFFISNRISICKSGSNDDDLYSVTTASQGSNPNGRNSGN